MKINKVDDKPMMIHTKQKAKIHTVESKKSEIKGSNILATARESNVKSAKTGSGSFRKSTVHQVEKVRRGRIFRYRQNLEQAKKSIKTKNSSIKIAGVEGVNSALDQLEGGEEIKKASGIAYGTVKPVSNAASKGATLFRQKAIEAKKRKIKKVDAGKKVAKKGAKKAVKDTAKATTKVVATTTTTAVGTGLAPGVGTTIGIGAGYAAGVAIDYKNMKGTNRSRKLKFFLDKMNAQEKQKDSFTRLVKDLIVSRVSMAVKSVAPIIGIVFLALVLIIAAVAIAVRRLWEMLYRNPYANG